MLWCVSFSQAQPSRATLTPVLNYKALQAGQQAVIAVVLDVRTGFHAQSHTPLDKYLIKYEVAFEADPNIEFGEPIYPTPTTEQYPALGKVSVYTGKTITYVPIILKNSAPTGALKLKAAVKYQICDDKSCFAPESPKIELETKVVPAGQTLEPNQPELFKDFDSTKVTTPPVAIPATRPAARSSYSDWTISTAFGAALLAGLLFNIMPCVLPVLPLKAIGFYEASHHNRAKSFAFGLVFSAGLISVFAVLAVVVLVLKFLTWGELFSKGWFIWSIVLVLVVLGFGLLGAWNLALPLGVYRFEPRHDTFGGNYFWGALTAILATPCTAPLLPPVMGWAAAKPPTIGVPAMLMVGVGMSLPYLLLSAMPELARKMPRSGPWTELFKQMMGFMLMAAAAYFAFGRLVVGPGFWWAVVAVVAVASFYLMARTAQLTRDGLPIGVAAVIAVAMLGGTLWWTAKITGLGGSANGTPVDAQWESYSEQRFDELRKSGQPILVKFTANWCGTCQYIEGTVFRDAKVWDQIKAHKLIAMKVDFSTDSEAEGKKLLLSLNPAGGIPITAIYGPNAEPPQVIESVYTSGELLRIVAGL